MRHITMLLVAALAVPAQAQEAASGSEASNTVNVLAITGAQGASEVTSKGHVWTTPNASAGYFGGANPCLVGESAAGAGGPIALSFSKAKSDEGCNRRSNAAALHALGLDPVAIALMCQDMAVADAFYAATSYACPGTDRERYRNAEYAVLASAPGQ
jgi:hypothetical protein